MFRKFPRLASLSWGAFFRGVFSLSGLIAFLFLGNAPVSAHSLGQAQDPNTTACSAPTAWPVGTGTIEGYSCFYGGYPTLGIASTKEAKVTVSFSSPHPYEQWQQCEVDLETIDTSQRNMILQGTEQQYDCLQDAQNSRTVVYGDDWLNLLNGSFLPVGQHSYQVVAALISNGSSASSQIFPLSSQIYTA